jgi:hypothetical protein
LSLAQAAWDDDFDWHLPRRYLFQRLSFMA